MIPQYLKKEGRAMVAYISLGFLVIIIAVIIGTGAFVAWAILKAQEEVE